jgi:hypothetical protein
LLRNEVERRFSKAMTCFENFQTGSKQRGDFVMGRRIFRIFVMMVLSWSILFLSGSQAQEDERSPVYQQLMEKLENLVPGETLEVKMGTEKEQYDAGEPLEIRFLANKDSHIILMDISTDGSITFLAPSHQVPDPRIEAGIVYSTGSPSPSTDENTSYDLGMKITVAPPDGIETINLFCSPEKIDLFEADFEQEPFYTIMPDDEERLKALLDRLEQLEQSEWSGQSIKIHIGPELPEGVRAVPRKYGALPPIGSTGTTGKFFPPIGSTGTTGKTEKN